MCELLALTFNKPVYPDFSFRGFRHRGASNPDGWGLAWFDKKANWHVIKRASASNRSTLVSKFLEQPPGPSRTFLAHVRYATAGNRSVKNTHPFTCSLNGVTIALIHNGTLHDLPLSRRKPMGKTDSERLLCVILDRLEDEKASFEDFKVLEHILLDLNEYGKLNTIISDGISLYAYRDKNGYNGLYKTFRRPPFKHAKLLDEELCCDLSKVKNPDTFGYVLASAPLTDENWKLLPIGKVSRFGTKTNFAKNK